MLPFTRDQFFGVLAAYNAEVWPAQPVAYLLGLLIAALVWRPTATSGRLVGAGLAAMWGWTGVAYHGLYFATINKAAYAFAALFVVQSLIFVYIGPVTGHLRFARDPAHPQRSLRAWTSVLLIAYAALFYPLIGLASGHPRGELPMFGITPCPLTIFTFGVWLLASPAPRWGWLAVPLVWSLIGGSAAFLLDVPQDWLLLISGVACVALLASARGPRRPVSLSA